MTRTVTFKVEPAKLFDALKAINGDTSAVGVRLVGVLMVEPSFADHIGLAMYGIEIVEENNENHTDQG